MSKPLVAKLKVLERRAELTQLQFEGSRFAFFKSIFAKSGKMAKINLLTVVFCIPSIIWFLFTFFLQKSYNTSINYSGNLGLGYGMIENAREQGDFAKFFSSVWHYAIFIPLIVVSFIGFGGALFAMRKLAQGDDKITKNFFIGIKHTFADFFLHGLLVGCVIFIFAVNFTIYDAYNIHIAIKIVGIILSIFILLITVSYIVYATTLSCFYKAGLFSIIKNSILFSVKLPLQTVFMAIVGALPIVVLYIALPGLFQNSGDFISSLLPTLGVSLVLFLGFSLIFSVWTVFTEYIYDIAFESAKTIKGIDSKQKNYKKKTSKG